MVTVAVSFRRVFAFDVLLVGGNPYLEGLLFDDGLSLRVGLLTCAARTGLQSLDFCRCSPNVGLLALSLGELKGSMKPLLCMQSKLIFLFVFKAACIISCMEKDEERCRDTRG